MFFKTLGTVLVVIGVIGGSFLPNILAGYTKAQRLGLEKRDPETPRKALRYQLIFIAVAVVGALLYILGGGDLIKWFIGE